MSAAQSADGAPTDDSTPPSKPAELKPSGIIGADLEQSYAEVVG